MPARPLVDVEGAVDIHIHAAPSYSHSRPYDDVTARQGAEHGLAAVLLKDHTESTVTRTSCDQGGRRRYPRLRGIVLNHPVGGVNPEAADFALTMGAKKVWMPTVDAARHAEVFGQGAIRSRRPASAPPNPTRSLGTCSGRSRSASWRTAS